MELTRNQSASRCSFPGRELLEGRHHIRFRSFEGTAVQEKERGPRDEARPLVAIDERMITTIP